MHEPDSKGHEYGPESEEIKETVTYLDSLVGIFLDKLKELDIYDQINFIVTSDHGMGPVTSDGIVFLEDYLKEDWIFTMQGSNPFINIKLNEGCFDSAYMALDTVEHIQVWKPDEVPSKLHYGSNPRVLDLIVVADSGWSVETVKKDRDYSGGAHGYDNDNMDMHTIFYALGPAFKENYSHPTFENIHIYPLISHILGLQPAENDGNLEEVADMLK
jgi:alkaline phosphatase D